MWFFAWLRRNALLGAGPLRCTALERERERESRH